MNHRVKNNLASILGILELEIQKGYQNADEFNNSINEINNRVRGLATLHDLLSASEWAPVPLSSLATKIIEGSLSNSPVSRHIQFSVDVVENEPFVSPVKATSLAFILNELTINCIKYTSSDVANIKINLKIQKVDDRETTIIFKDNGPGWPEEVIKGERSGTGLRLIRNYIRSTLKGKMELLNDNGAAIAITFKHS